MPNTHEYSLVVVGAGIVGLAVAREFARRHPGESVLVLEKESEVAAHQSGHNSGVIHGGIYYQPGSLKARLCVEGSRLMYEYCQDKGIAHERCGKLIVALESSELDRLDELERRGIVNEVPGLRRVGRKEIPEIEPRARGIEALHAPNTGIVDYAEVARALAADLAELGVQVRLGTRVDRIDPDERGGAAITAAGVTVSSRKVMVCAGLWSDRLAREAGAPADPRIVPFRGAYLKLRPRADAIVRGMIYPVPDPELPFLGVHVTRHIDGSIALGPTAIITTARDGYRLSQWRSADVWETVTWPGTWKVAQRFWRTGLTEMHLAASRRAFVEAAARYVPGLTLDDLDGSATSGVRAQAVGRDGALVDDFVLSTIGAVTFVRNAPSPAATASLAIARELVDHLVDQSA